MQSQRLQPTKLPRVVLDKDWADFIDGFNHSEYKNLSEEIARLYKEYDLSKYHDPEERQRFLEQYPLAEHTDFYVLSEQLSVLFTERAIRDTYTVADRMEYDQKVIAYAEETLSGEALRKTLDAILYHGCEYMKQLSLPATVKEVEIPEVAFDTISFAGTTKQWEEVKTALHGSVGVSVECRNGQGSLPGNAFYPQDNTYAEPLNLPDVMLVADYEDMMIRMVESDDINEFTLLKTSAYYHHLRLNDCKTEQSKAELIDAFPEAEFYAFYRFDTNANQDERFRIAQYLTTYAGYSARDRADAEDRVAALNAYYLND